MGISRIDETGQGRSQRLAAGGAWLLWALALGGLALGLLLDYASSSLAAGSLILAPVLLAFATAGALVAARRPANPIGWIMDVAALLGALYLFAAGYAAEALLPHPGAPPASPLPGGVWAAWAASWAGKLGFVLLFVFVPLLFPDGRLPSARWRPAAGLAAAWLALLVGATMLVPGTMNNAYPAATNPIGLEHAADALNAILAVSFPSLLLVAILPTAALIVRFRRATPEARQQIKWVAFASCLLLAWVVVDALLSRLPQLAGPDALLLTVALVSFPAAIGIAMLKYRLYDIDLIIHRTLVYSLISALLAPAYFGSVVALQAIFRAATGATSQAAIVMTTLGIAALFFPVRRGVQAFIDRRFYRRKYDAAKTLAEFAAAARDETDLDKLTERLVAVTQETVQPETVGVWLRAGGSRQEAVGRRREAGG